MSMSRQSAAVTPMPGMLSRISKRAFRVSLAAAGFALVKVNPRQARRFAEATGRLAKTDGMDAAMLARMGAILDIEARPVRSQLLSDLKDLHMAREALVKSRTAAKNRAKTLILAILKRQNAAQLRQIERQITAIEAEIMALIRPIPTWQSASTSSSRSRASRLLPPSRSLSTCPNSEPSAWPGGFSSRPRARRTAIRKVDRSRLHPRRTRQCPTGALYARARRNALQSRTQGKIRTTQSGWQSLQSRHHRHHAKAPPPRQRIAQRPP
jgi:hypothetical protein